MPRSTLSCATQTVEVVKAGVVVLGLIRGNRDGCIAGVVVLLEPGL